MTRIDFHSNVADKLAYTCRLVRKALANSAQCVILVDGAEQLSQLDQALWALSAGDFLPHVRAGDPLARCTPVILTENDGVDLPHHQILINLTPNTPPQFARFERMFEIISSDDADAAAGRARYSFYKQRGYALSHSVASAAS